MLCEGDSNKTHRGPPWLCISSQSTAEPPTVQPCRGCFSCTSVMRSFAKHDGISRRSSAITVKLQIRNNCRLGPFDQRVSAPEIRKVASDRLANAVAHCQAASQTNTQEMAIRAGRSTLFQTLVQQVRQRLEADPGSLLVAAGKVPPGIAYCAPAISQSRGEHDLR